ncbi:MAG: phiB5 08 [Acidimicrobiales bacterium]|nr:phiB5 08 [Acidimicrobiales bacterium]
MRGIRGYVGKNGSGKSLAAVEQVAVPALERGRPVVSNLTLFASVGDAELPSAEREPHPLWTKLEHPRQIPTLRHCTLVLDDVTSCFSSRESGKIPAAVVTMLQSLRHNGVDCAWTAPSWMRADKILRECTLEVVHCRGMLSQRSKDPDEWPPNRLFRWKTYSAEDFEEFSLSSAQSTQKGSLRAVRSQWYRRSRHDAQHLYDTLETVSMLEHLDEFSNCLECGGTRRRPKCECVDRSVS